MWLGRSVIGTACSSKWRPSRSLIRRKLQNMIMPQHSSVPSEARVLRLCASAPVSCYLSCYPRGGEPGGCNLQAVPPAQRQFSGDPLRCEPLAATQQELEGGTQSHRDPQGHVWGPGRV